MFINNIIRNRTPRAIVNHNNHAGLTPPSSQSGEITKKTQKKKNENSQSYIVQMFRIFNLHGASAGSKTNTVVEARSMLSSDDFSFNDRPPLTCSAMLIVQSSSSGHFPMHCIMSH